MHHVNSSNIASMDHACSDLTVAAACVSIVLYKLEHISREYDRQSKKFFYYCSNQKVF